MQDSAFKPYQKSPIEELGLCQNFSPDDEPSRESSSTSPVTVTTCSTSTSPQVKAFDYTVEKLLKSSHANVSSTISSAAGHEDIRPDSCHPSLTEMTKWSSIPLSLIARHLWWQGSKSFASLAEGTTSSREISSSGLSTASSSASMSHEQLRRYLIQATSPRPRLPRSQRRQRTTFTHEQTLRLEMEYHVSEYISRSKRFQLAELLELTENQIKIWFQNRRAKDKRIEKAICEQQQFRYVPPLTVSLGSSLTTSNCSTCHYTQQQFDGQAVPTQPTDQRDHS